VIGLLVAAQCSLVRCSKQLCVLPEDVWNTGARFGLSSLACFLWLTVTNPSSPACSPLLEMQVAAGVCLLILQEGNSLLYACAAG